MGFTLFSTGWVSSLLVPQLSLPSFGLLPLSFWLLASFLDGLLTVYPPPPQGIVPTTILLLSHMNLMLGTSGRNETAGATFDFRARSPLGVLTTLRSDVVMNISHEGDTNEQGGHNEFPLEFRENMSTVGQAETSSSKAEPLV